MPKVWVNSIDLYYESRGRGFPVVFSHGFAGTTRAWEPQLAALSRGYRFITYDLRGHGQTEAPAEPSAYSHEAVVEDLFQLLKHLGVSRAVVGGLSIGGYISLYFYARHPEMVQALILMDTGPGYRNPERREAWNRERRAVADLFLQGGMKAYADSPYSIDYTPRELLLTMDPVGLANFTSRVVSMSGSVVMDSLPRIQVPTLVLVGENDTPYLASTDYMARVIPNAEKVVLPGAGHGANRDQPQLFNVAVLRFLEKAVPR